MITTIYNENTAELAKAGINVLADNVDELLLHQEKIVLAIAGGRSVSGMWKLLTQSRIRWDKVQIIMVDERVVPPTHNDSNYKLAHDSFLKTLIESGKLPKDNVHPFHPKETQDRGSIYYNNQLSKLGSKPDILILGVGEDGHVGALYPNHNSVKNNSEGYIVMDDSPKPPPVRITMSRNTMLKAKVSLLLFIGEAKQDAYDKFKAGENIDECPARLAKKIKNSYVLTNLK